VIPATVRSHEVPANTTVVIPAHNAASVIGGQLAALAAQVGAGDFEVVVALNRCTDRTRDVVSDFERVLDLRVVDANERASAAYARNRAASSAGGDLLLFCDIDDEVGPRWVAEMAAALGGADLVGGRVALDQRGCPSWIRDHLHVHLATDALHLHDGRIPYPVGASLGCRREPFLAVGGFDETFPGAGGEEPDLAIRTVQASYRLGYAPDATLLYRPLTSFRAVLAQRRSYARGGALERHGVGSVVEVRTEAVGATAGRVSFFEHDLSVVSGAVPSPLAPDPGAKRQVDVVPLDEAVASPVAALKIDVEGGKVGVLDGARELLARSPQIAVMVGVNPAALGRFGTKL
jgi:FkbM family methyltransferase